MEITFNALKIIGYGMAIFAPAFGIAIACHGCCMATARQPEAGGRLFTNFIVGAALIEALGLIGFVLALIV